MTVAPIDAILAQLDLSDVAGGSIADKALAYAQVTQLLKDLGALKSELEQLIVETMEEDTVTIEHLGTLVRRKKGKRTRWEGGRILNRLVNNFTPVDTETGQVLSEPRDIAERAMTTLYEAGGLHRPSHSWSTTGLQKYGLRPGEFSDFTEQGYSVELVS